MTPLKSKLMLLSCLLVLTGSRNNDLGIYPCGLGDQTSINEILKRSQKALMTNPNNTDALFERSYALFINGQINEGMTLCEKLLTLENTFRSRDLHYRILKRVGKFDQSLADAEIMMRSEKETAFLLTCQFMKATFLYRLGRTQEALALCEDVSKDLSEDSEVFFLKSLCYNRLNDKKKELESLERAVSIAPTNSQYRLNRAINLSSSNKDRAMRDLNLFCALNPKHTPENNIQLEYAFSFSKAAAMFLEMKEYARALELCKMGLAQGEEKYEIWKTQAQALIKTGKTKEAQNVIQQAETWLKEQDTLLKAAKKDKQ